MRRWLIAGTAAVAAVVVVTGVAWVLLARTGPARLSVGEARQSPSPSPTAQDSAELARLRAWCIELAPPEQLDRCLAGMAAYRSACGSVEQPAGATPPAGRWLVGSGSQAGMRVHERFLILELPHEAVARTDEVAGGMLVTGTQGALTVTDACIAVSTLNLHSVDSVPGMRTSERDPIIADVTGAVMHPVAVFKADQLRLPAGASDGKHQSVRAPGTFSIHGVTRRVTVTLDAVAHGEQLEIAGELPIVLADYGMAPPENPVAAIDPKVTIEFHIFMDLR